MAAVDAEAVEHALLDFLSSAPDAEVICRELWYLTGVQLCDGACWSSQSFVVVNENVAVLSFCCTNPGPLIMDE